MKLILIALCAALLATPASAGVTYGSDVTTGVTGNLTTITTDAVRFNLLGSRWASVYVTVNSAGSATATAQYFADSASISQVAFNPLPSTYCKKISQISSNPTVQAITATTLVTGDVWECYLPANATAFQFLCAGTGTSTNITIAPGLPYVPGVQVAATLYDVTSGTNTDNPTGTLDFGGWASAFVAFSSGGATTIAPTATQIADDGTGIGGNYTLITAATAGKISLNRQGNQTSTALTKRMNFDVQPVAAQQTRLRVEAYR